MSISLSVCFYIISEVLFAKYSRISGVFSINFIRSCILVILQIPFLFFIDFQQITSHIIILSSIFGLFGLIYFGSFVYSFQFLPAGIASFILSLESIVVIILSYYIYHETLSFVGCIGTILLILSGIFISYKKIEFHHLDKRWPLGILFGILGMLGGALWGFGFAYISRETSIFIGSFLSQLSIFIWYLLILFLRIFSQKSGFSFEIKNIKMYIIAASIYGLANIFYFYATTLGPISLSILFLAFCPLGVAVLGHYFLKEKLHIFQYIFFFIGLIGIFLINF